MPEKFKRLRVLSLVYLGLSLLLVGISSFTGVEKTAVAVTSDNFAASSFKNSWQRTDQPIATRKISRSWYWGPEPRGGGFYENYAGSPFGKRLVQYFDKARMELNNPAENQVTNGLLVEEMITGRLQIGDNSFQDKGSANVPVAGDPDNAFPTYRDLKSYFNRPAGLQPGETVTALLTPGGPGTQGGYRADPGAKIASIQQGFGIPAAFWNYLNRQGLVTTPGGDRNEVISDWLFSTGYPVTEAFWTRVRVGGVERDVLFQAYERRLLTYTPSNSANYQVEMGNVGLHYIQWRYNGQLPNYSTPLASIFEGEQSQWYTSTDALNIRTAPNSQAPRPDNTKNHPFVEQMQAGDNVQVIREVQGEEILKGNSTWYQIYEKPDLFVYSGYLKKAVLPDYPAPPRAHSGLWVSVSTSRQMMAVFDGDRLIYKTLVATGIPGVGSKDYSTVKGVYNAIGSYRPASQTMQGGSRASDTYYSLEDVRYVTYFYQDYAIHGSYWHTKYGIAPQSHGCVNATVYDASLIWRLPAGTVVDVF